MSRWSLFWYTDLLRQGRRTKLRLRDLGTAFGNQDSGELYLQFEKAWVQRNHKSSNPLLRALCTTFGRAMLAPVVQSLLWCCFTALSPVLLHALLEYMAWALFVLGDLTRDDQMLQR